MGLPISVCVPIAGLSELLEETLKCNKPIIPSTTDSLQSYQTPIVPLREPQWLRILFWVPDDRRVDY